MNRPVQTARDHSPGMASASLILGLFSVIMIATGFSFIIGSIGIILALMSRGRGPLTGKARTGLITSVVGIAGGIIVTLVAFFSLFSGDWNQAINRLDYLYETYMNEGTLNPSDIDRALTDQPTNGNANDQTALVISYISGEEVDA